jgi:subtilisin family serine protease
VNKVQHLYEEFGIVPYHARGIKGSGVKIAVIDTGMDTPKSKWGTGHQVPKHGLAVSSILSGVDSHFQGICPDAKVVVIDLLASKNIPISSVLKAIESAIEQQVDILSISLGTPDSWLPMQQVIDKALARNILVFAAAGNSGDRGYEYPSACQGAISVASINEARQPSVFNTRNDATVLFAPGEQLSLSVGNGQLAEFSGTSFATPFAAGLAALVLSAKRAEDPKAIYKRREMIDILRSDTHLGLNCQVHSYVMEPTCTETRTISHFGQRKHSHVYLMLLFCLLTFVVYGITKL